jgi:AraC-like DNA-binding protein
MNKLSRSEIFKIGKVLVKKEESKSFIKQIATINNQFIDLKIINAMVEDNIYLNIVDNNIKQSHIQKLRIKDKQLQIRIILQGMLEKLNHSRNEKRIYNKNEISIEYEENVEESLLNKQDQHLKYICITLDEKYLNENKYLNDIFNNAFCKKFYEPDLENRFYELFNREYTSGLDKIYLKNKTMETILYVLDKIKKIDELNFIGLNDEDINRIKKAKIIMEESLHENITIMVLAKKVALNQTKLKKGFKQLFGKTIHEYLKNLRLQKAVEYLKINKYSVREVSLMVGYTNQGSFSYAFSNKFNCSPKEIQKKSDL